MTGCDEMDTATFVMPESEAIIALGSRTTVLHPEIKRHRAWWKEILRSRVHEKIAKRVSSPAAAAKDPPSLLVDGERHAHVHLVEQAGLLLSSEGKRRVFDLLAEVKAVATAARGRQGLDLESTELAAVLCGYDGERGTTRLLCTVTGGDAAKGKSKARQQGHGGSEPAVPLAKALSSDRVEAMGLQADKVELNAGDFGSTLAGEAYEIRRRSSRRQRLPEGGGGGSNEGNSNSGGDGGVGGGEGRIVLQCCDDLAATAAQLAAQVNRARAWNERHRGCFLPIAWVVCATLAAKWPQEGLIGVSPSEPNQGRQGVSSSGVKATSGRPSPFSLLALLAAFLDRESASRGVSKDTFRVGENPTFGRRNPNLAEIFLGFCSFVRRLGAGDAPTVTLEVLANGETIAKVAEMDVQKEAVLALGSESNGSKETDALEEGTGPILLAVEGELRKDLLDPHLASGLRRACRDVELSLTPDRVRGLPVWNQDIRWSLLGHALEPAQAVGKEPTEIGEYSYLEWMEVKLLMCMNEAIDTLPGLYGYHVTGSLPLRPGDASRQQKRRVVAEAAAWAEADVERCRSADAAFAAAIAAETAEGERKEQKIENGDSDDVAMSDSLYGTDEDIDGVPMSPDAEQQPQKSTLAPQVWPTQGSAPFTETKSGKTSSSGMLESREREKRVEGGVGSSSTDSASKIGAVLAHGDRVMRAVADAVAAAKAGGAGASCADRGDGGEACELSKRGGKDDENEGEKLKGKEKERTLAKALAKERGRERGKQREKERAAELAAKKREEVVKERSRRERLEKDRERSERQEDRFLEKVARKIDAAKRAKLNNPRERKQERYASLAARHRRRSRSINSSTDSSSSDSSENTSPNRSSSGGEKGVSPRRLGSGSGGGGGGGRVRGRVARRGGDSRSRGSRRSRSNESRRDSKKRGSRSRSRSGWRNRGRSSNYSDNNIGGGRVRGENRNARSPSPPSDARRGRGNEKTSKKAEGERGKEGERELPTSTVWSEWRSVSSEDCSNDDLARDRSVIRSVTASGVSVDGGGSSGLVIRLKRGPSLERLPASAEAAVSASAEAASVEAASAAVTTEAVAVRGSGTGDGGAGVGNRTTTASSSSRTQQRNEGGSSSGGTGKRSDDDDDDIHRRRRGEDLVLSSRSRTGERGGGREGSRRAPYRIDGRARARSPKRGGDDNSSRRSGRRSTSRDRSRSRRGDFLPSSQIDSAGGDGKAREYHRSSVYRSRSRSGERRRRLRRSRSRSRSSRRRSRSGQRLPYRRNRSRSRESRVGRPSSCGGETSGNYTVAALEEGATEAEEGEVLPEPRGAKSTVLRDKIDGSRGSSTGERRPDLVAKAELVGKQKGVGKIRRGTPVAGAAVTRVAKAGNAEAWAVKVGSKCASSSSQVEVAETSRKQDGGTGTGGEPGEVGNESSPTCERVVQGESTATGSVAIKAEASEAFTGETVGSGSRETTGGDLCGVVDSGCGPGDGMGEFADHENLVGTLGEVKPGTKNEGKDEGKGIDAVNDKGSGTTSTAGELTPEILPPPATVAAAVAANRAPVLSVNGQATTVQGKQKRTRWDIAGSSPTGQSAVLGEAVVPDSLETTDGGAGVKCPGDRAGELVGMESLNLDPGEVGRGDGDDGKDEDNGTEFPVGRSASEAIRALLAAAQASVSSEVGQENRPRRVKRWGVALAVETSGASCGSYNSGGVEGPGDRADKLAGPESIDLGPGEVRRGDRGGIKGKDDGDGAASTMVGSASEVTPSPADAPDARATLPFKDDQATLARQKKTGRWGVAVEGLAVKDVASGTGAPESQDTTVAVLGGGCDSGSAEGLGNMADELVVRESLNLRPGEAGRGDRGEMKCKDEGNGAASSVGGSAPEVTPSLAAAADARATLPSKDGQATLARQKNPGRWGVDSEALTVKAVASGTGAPGSQEKTGAVLGGGCDSGSVAGPGNMADNLAGPESLELGPGEAGRGDGGEMKGKDEGNGVAHPIGGSAPEVTPSPAAAADARASVPFKDGQEISARRKKTGRWGVTVSSRGQGDVAVEALTVKAVASGTGTPGSLEKTGAVLGGGCDSGSVEVPDGQATECVGLEGLNLELGEVKRDGGGVDVKGKGRRAAPSTGWSAPAVPSSSAAAPAQATAPSRGGHASPARKKQKRKRGGMRWMPGGVDGPPGRQGAAPIEGVAFGAVSLGTITPATTSMAHGSQEMAGAVLGRVDGSGGVENPGVGEGGLAGFESVVEEPEGVVRGAEGEDKGKGKSFGAAPVVDGSAAAVTPPAATTAAVNRATVPSEGGQATPTQKKKRWVRRGKRVRSAVSPTGQGRPCEKKPSIAAYASGHQHGVPHPPRQEGESATSVDPCSVGPQGSDGTVSGPSVPVPVSLQQGGGSSSAVGIAADASNGREEERMEIGDDRHAAASKQRLGDAANSKAPSESGSGSAGKRHAPTVRGKNWLRNHRKRMTKMRKEISNTKGLQGKVE